jgi:hypothetical protein
MFIFIVRPLYVLRKNPSYPMKRRRGGPNAIFVPKRREIKTIFDTMLNVNEIQSIIVETRRADIKQQNSTMHV